MAVTTLSAPVIGIAHVGAYQVRVQVRPDAQAAWLTLLGRSDYESFTVGTLTGLDTSTPQLRVFQRLQRWATPTVRSILTAAVVRMWRDYRAERPVVGDGA